MTSIFTQSARKGSIYGAQLAGPVVRDVVNYIFYRDKDWHRTITPSAQKQVPTSIKGGNIAQIRRVADKFSPRISFTDREGWGVATMDTLLNVNVSTIEHENLMPNVVGMGLKDALYILESRGLRVHFSGRGTVRTQSIAVGRKIAEGESVTITLK